MSKVVVGLCGPNGSGKSTAYHGMVRDGSLRRLPWVNADEILVQFRESGELLLSSFGLGDVSATAFNLAAENHSLHKFILSTDHTLGLLAYGEPARLAVDDNLTAYEAALAAAVIRELLIRQGESFAFETVMSHPSKIELFQQANSHSFTTQMIFVCTDNVELNVRRVAERVQEGGHGVPVEKIRARYHSAIELLPRAAAVCDVVTLVDTSDDSFRIIGTKADGAWTTRAPIPAWAIPTIPT